MLQITKIILYDNYTRYTVNDFRVNSNDYCYLSISMEHGIVLLLYIFKITECSEIISYKILEFLKP